MKLGKNYIGILIIYPIATNSLRFLWETTHSYPLPLHLSGHQTNERPNSASEALRESAIDSGREQSWPGVWAWGRRVRWTSSGSRVGLPFYWNFRQEQDYGGRAVRGDRPTDELFFTAGEAGAVLHSLCGTVRKRYKHCHSHSLAWVHLYLGCAHEHSTVGHSLILQNVIKCPYSACVKMVHKLRRNVTHGWLCGVSVRCKGEERMVGSEKDEWVVLLRANRWFSLLS